MDDKKKRKKIAKEIIERISSCIVTERTKETSKEILVEDFFINLEMGEGSNDQCNHTSV